MSRANAQDLPSAKLSSGTKLPACLKMIGENRFTLTEIALELRKLLKHRIAENEAHTPNETGQKGKDRNAGTRNLKAKQIEELLNTL